MNESELVKETMDWFLPMKHEAAYTGAFMQGGRTMIDIGAHVGTWTLRLAPLFKRVICFEPDPRGAEALKKNVELAGMTHVEVITKAVSDKTGTARLTLYPNPCTNTMLPEETARVDASLMTVDVSTVSLDEFVRERGITDIDFIKVDAEGAEVLIIPGALETIRTQRPDFYIELHGMFFERIRRMLDFEKVDLIDGGRTGLNLVRHRDAWPEFSNRADFRIYPHGTTPTLEQVEQFRTEHGVPMLSATSGILSVEG